MDISDLNCIYDTINCLRQATNQLKSMNQRTNNQLYDDIKHYKNAIKKAEEAYKRIERCT